MGNDNDVLIEHVKAMARDADRYQELRHEIRQLSAHLKAMSETYALEATDHHRQTGEQDEWSSGKAAAYSVASAKIERLLSGEAWTA